MNSNTIFQAYKEAHLRRTDPDLDDYDEQHKLIRQEFKFAPEVVRRLMAYDQMRASRIAEKAAAWDAREVYIHTPGDDDPAYAGWENEEFRLRMLEKNDRIAALRAEIADLKAKMALMVPIPKVVVEPPYWGPGTHGSLD